MSREQFLQELEYILKSKNVENASKTLEHYENKIDNYIKNGASEEEAVACLDSPQEIFDKMSINTSSEDNNLKKPFKIKEKSKGVLTVILMALASIFCFTAVVSAVIVMVVMFSIEVILALGGFSGVIGSVFFIFKHFPTALFLLGISLVGISIVVISVKPFLRLCAITIAIALNGLRRTLLIVSGNQKEKYE